MKKCCHVYFRCPGESHYTFLRGETTQHTAPGELLASGRNGFVISAFDESSGMVFIPADETVRRSLPPTGTEGLAIGHTAADPSYETEFEAFHSAVASGRFRKLVLSRTRTIPCRPDALQSFFNACLAYPDMMVMLFSTPVTGTWLVASPELLLQYSDGRCRTVALAGTMPYDGQEEPVWSAKDKEEQGIVSEFIASSIKASGAELRTNGPNTVRAGNLVHLKTEMEFSSNPVGAAEMIGRLHPTPAVCGVPATEAKRFIIANETVPRRCYSGFAGPVGFNGCTSLYVSIRCAELLEESVILYAGGGIMPESSCAGEFDETEHKMQTIARCIATKRT